MEAIANGRTAPVFSLCSCTAPQADYTVGRVRKPLNSSNRKLKTIIMTRLPRTLEALARMLTYLLCHRPDEFGLVLDADGFVAVKHLLQALGAEPGWGWVRRQRLEEVAAMLQPPRFELTGEQMRARSPEPANLRRPPGETPPALLYAAIPPKAHERVWEEGLKPACGRELVLAATRETALKLGRRRAPDLVLVTVQAQAAARSGITFQGYGEELFLAPAAIARDFLQMPPPPQSPAKPKPEQPARPAPPPGALEMSLSDFLQKTPPRRGKKDEPAWKAGTRALRKKRRRGQ